MEPAFRGKESRRERRRLVGGDYGYSKRTLKPLSLGVKICLAVYSMGYASTSDI